MSQEKRARRKRKLPENIQEIVPSDILRTPELIQHTLSFMDDRMKATACMVSRFWNQEAKEAARHECRQYLPNAIVDRLSNPILVSHRLKRLFDLRYLVFYPGNVHYGRHLQRDIGQSSLLLHAVCYPYNSRRLNARAEKSFGEKVLARDILVRVGNVSGVNFLVANLEDSTDLESMIEVCYRSNNREIIQICSNLNTSEDLPDDQETEEYDGYDRLKDAANHACDTPVYDAIISAYSWDSLKLTNTLLTECSTKYVVINQRAADIICPAWREFDQEIVDEKKLSEKFSECTFDKYFLMYAIVYSGKINLINALFNYLVQEGQLRYYPNYFLGALLVFFVHQGRYFDAKLLQNCVLTGDYSEEEAGAIALNPDEWHLAEYEEIYRIFHHN